MLNAIYQFYSDPGHGWLKVYRSELIKLGIAKNISRYSYQDNKTGQIIYLEEDDDAPKFLNAMKNKNIRVKCEENFENGESFIRGLVSYKG